MSRRSRVIKQRILTAIFALPLLILLIGFASPVVFSLFIALVLLLALLEFNRMGLAEAHVTDQRLAAILGVSFLPLLYSARETFLLPLVTALILLAAMLLLFRVIDISLLKKRFGWLSLGLLYLPFLLGHLVLLRFLPDGQAWIFLTILVIMVCDTAAYFVGSNFGKRKLYPRVSPNKSIEGGIGGLIGSGLAVLIAGMTFLPQIGLVDGLLLGVLLGVSGQLGDLFESLLKRACGVKDSGTLVPGHGGLLDRLDSLLFAFPIVYYLARFGYGG